MNNIINTSEIEVGDTFATYAKLVKALGLDSCTGKQRVYQEKEIRRYIDFEKTGKINPKTHKESNEIIVTEIYDEPLEKKDNRDVFNTPMKTFICHNCSHNKKIIKTFGSMMVDMGLIEKTRDVYSNIRDDNAVKTYKYQLKRLFRNHLTYALSSLEKEDKIDYRFTYKLQETEEQDFGKWAVADRKETETIKKIETDCRKELEEKYEKPFNSLKFDTMIYEEYDENCKKQVNTELGYCSYCPVIEIENHSFCDSISYELYNAECEAIRKPFINAMRKKITEYHYSLSDSKARGGKKFGNRETDAYYILNTQEIRALHNRILNDNFEDVAPTVLEDDDEQEVIAVSDDNENVSYNGMSFDDAFNLYVEENCDNPFMPLEDAERAELLEEFKSIWQSERKERNNNECK